MIAIPFSSITIAMLAVLCLPTRADNLSATRGGDGRFVKESRGVVALARLHTERAIAAIEQSKPRRASNEYAIASSLRPDMIPKEWKDELTLELSPLRYFERNGSTEFALLQASDVAHNNRDYELERQLLARYTGSDQKSVRLRTELKHTIDVSERIRPGCAAVVTAGEYGIMSTRLVRVFAKFPGLTETLLFPSSVASLQWEETPIGTTNRLWLVQHPTGNRVRCLSVCPRVEVHMSTGGTHVAVVEFVGPTFEKRARIFDISHGTNVVGVTDIGVLAGEEQSLAVINGRGPVWHHVYRWVSENVLDVLLFNNPTSGVLRNCEKVGDRWVLREGE